MTSDSASTRCSALRPAEDEHPVIRITESAAPVSEAVRDDVRRDRT